MEILGSKQTKTVYQYSAGSTNHRAVNEHWSSACHMTFSHMTKSYEYPFTRGYQNKLGVSCPSYAFAWVVGETSVGPPSGVDPVGTMRLRISNNNNNNKAYDMVCKKICDMVWHKDIFWQKSHILRSVLVDVHYPFWNIFDILYILCMNEIDFYFSSFVIITNLSKKVADFANEEPTLHVPSYRKSLSCCNRHFFTAPEI